MTFDQVCTLQTKNVIFLHIENMIFSPGTLSLNIMLFCYIFELSNNCNFFVIWLLHLDILCF